ncbi:lipocalin family protein [Mucilaginibacter sabulilitoris]|uniref:Lipocalin family protein n=1 Tax=Mucilaginibacter sabulilitoris TaxID=1173583 RepID=A0ABZ0TR95_9SPHI|nr:lipocalin family protein [Mucilaginibacter sabulilitoris]WPU95655.1 lipocalin family protein [Mucilaginibacter sabulilitoris]
MPIFLDYNILDIDEHYKFALVSGSGMGYLWLLSRESSMPEEMEQRFLQRQSPWVLTSTNWNGWAISK